MLPSPSKPRNMLRMNENIHGERTASEPQDRSSSVAHSIEVPSEIIRKWQEIVNLLAEIMHVPSASIMRVDPPHIKVFVSSTSEGNPCEPGALDTGPYCETVMKTGQPLLIPDALENEAWKANPHVRLGMISYLGVPIGWPNGRIFGTICVRDNKRNEYSEAYLKLLLHFRDMLQADLKSLARLHGEIEERETKIRRLVDSNIIGVFIWDFDGRILEANDEFLRMVSYDREDLVSGRIIRWADLTPPDWRDRNNARIEQQKSSGRFEAFEKENTRKDGSRVPVLIGGATFEEGGNQGVAYVLDLTERKRIEAEARENEQRYREAQLELAHVTRVMTLGELTASIAHEVNQPLAGVVANAEACLRWLDRRTPDLDAVRRSVEWVIDDSNRASAVIGRIRALAKKTEIEKVPLDVNDVVRETIPLVQRELISHQVLLRMELAPTLPMILGDRVQLQQVIINLVMNGIESMQSTDRPRELVVRSRQDETQQVLVSVADCGVGISAENADRLFTAFFTTKSSGMGMGLSICRSIIDAHGGRLWATTCEPRGALFQFTIPAD